MSFRATGIVVLGVFALALVGCGGSGPSMAPVSGTLLSKGKALNEVRIEFWPEVETGANAKCSSAVTDAEGKFTLEGENNLPGAMQGKHRVVLHDIFVTKGLPRKRELDDDEAAKKYAAVIHSRIPKDFSSVSTTPLKREVKSGPNTFEIDITQP